MDRDGFVDAIAPHEDFTKIRRDQFSVLFKVADQSQRGLISWDDFTVFQTLLKRPDADYLIAFKFFDVYVLSRRMFASQSERLDAETVQELSISLNSRMCLLLC